MKQEKTNLARAPSRRIQPEYYLIGGLLLLGVLAAPAVADAYLVQSLVLSICTGLGLQ